MFDPESMTNANPPEQKAAPTQGKGLTRGFNDVEMVIAKTMEYLGVPPVVGHEQFFVNYLKKDFEAIGLTASKHEGILEIHGAKPHSAVLCAHIDRHGLISLGKGEYAYAAQYIREIKYGEPNRASRRELENLGKRSPENPFTHMTRTLASGLARASSRSATRS
jgi:hypothetical protein